MLAALVLTTILTAACPSGAELPCVVRNQATISKYVGQPVGLSWPCNVPPCPEPATRFEIEWYEVKLVEPATQTPVAVGTVPGTVREFTWTPRKAGYFWARIRACAASGCSRWVASWDPADTDPAKYPRGFLVQTILPAPTGGGIE